jgi:hypothetical protein
MPRTEAFSSNLQRRSKGNQSVAILLTFQMRDTKLSERNSYIGMISLQCFLSHSYSFLANFDCRFIVSCLQVNDPNVVQGSPDSKVTRSEALSLSAQDFLKDFQRFVVLAVSKMLGCHLMNGIQVPIGLQE